MTPPILAQAARLMAVALPTRATVAEIRATVATPAQVTSAAHTCLHVMADKGFVMLLAASHLYVCPYRNVPCSDKTVVMADTYLADNAAVRLAAMSVRCLCNQELLVMHTCLH